MNTRVLLYLLGIGGAMAMSVTFCTRAPANTLDDVYVESLHDVGISAAAGDAGLITLGHFVCSAFGIGESFDDVKTLIVSNNPKLDRDGAAQIVGAATAAYCPAFTWKFGVAPPKDAAPRGTGVVA